MSSRLDAMNGRVTATNALVSQIIKCNEKKMVYAPASAPAGSDGCIKSGGEGRWYKVGTASTTEPYGCQYLKGGIPFNCKTRGISPPAGYPMCGGDDGVVARKCGDTNQRCARTASASSTVYQPENCQKVHFGDSQTCSGGGNVTTTSTWYDLYACE